MKLLKQKKRLAINKKLPYIVIVLIKCITCIISRFM